MSSQTSQISGLYAIDIKFSRSNKTFRERETVSGTISIITKNEIKHDGVIIEFDGSVTIQLSAKNLAFLDAFSGGVKPIQLAGGWCQELSPPGKIPVGKTEFPFQFVLEPKPNRSLYETYHGVYVAIQYTVKCDIKRSFPAKSIQKTGEFIVESSDEEAKATEKPVTFTITPESVHNRERFGNVGRFHIAGRLDSISCCIEKAFTGEVTVAHCDRVIRSIDVQLLRIETCGASEGYGREASEIQTIQIGDGDVMRQTPIPIYMDMIDESTKTTLSNLPLLKTKAGPRDGDLWIQRLKEEYQALIKYVENNKAADTDWFRLESNKDGTRWFGKCWHFHDMIRYEFDVEFDIPVTYPTTAPEIAIPELDGKTAKMYRGGKICLSDHFKPLWARNVPKFGIAQAFALGLGPWLAVELPDLVEKSIIKPKSSEETPGASA